MTADPAAGPGVVGRRGPDDARRPGHPGVGGGRRVGDWVAVVARRRRHHEGHPVRKVRALRVGVTRRGGKPRFVRPRERRVGGAFDPHAVAEGRLHAIPVVVGGAEDGGEVGRYRRVEGLGRERVRVGVLDVGRAQPPPRARGVRAPAREHPREAAAVVADRPRLDSQRRLAGDGLLGDQALADSLELQLAKDPQTVRELGHRAVGWRVAQRQLTRRGPEVHRRTLQGVGLQVQPRPRVRARAASDAGDDGAGVGVGFAAATAPPDPSVVAAPAAAAKRRDDREQQKHKQEQDARPSPSWHPRFDLTRRRPSYVRAERSAKRRTGPTRRAACLPRPCSASRQHDEPRRAAGFAGPASRPEVLMTQATPSSRAAATSTPRADGFRLPARFTPHQRTLLSWPCREDLFGPLMEDARAEWAEVGCGIARFEPVTVVVDPAQEAEAREALGLAADATAASRTRHRPPPHPARPLVDPRQRSHLRAQRRRRGGRRPVPLRRLERAVHALRQGRRRRPRASPRPGRAALRGAVHARGRRLQHRRRGHRC